MKVTVYDIIYGTVYGFIDSASDDVMNNIYYYIFSVQLMNGVPLDDANFVRDRMYGVRIHKRASQPRDTIHPVSIEICFIVNVLAIACSSSQKPFTVLQNQTLLHAIRTL